MSEAEKRDPKEVLYDRVMAAEPIVQAELFELFKNSTFCAALKALALASDSQAQNLLGADLLTPQGVAQAQLAQGIARGLSTGVELLIDIATETTTTTTTEPTHDDQ